MEASSTTYPVNRNAEGHDAWKAAHRLTDFSFPWLDREAPRTSFRALWDEDFFSFRFDAEDDDLTLAEGASDSEKVLGSDRVEIFFAANDELNPYYCLEIDPRGLVHDYRGRHYRDFDPAWSCPGLDVESVLRAAGYTVTGRIPLATFTELDLLAPEARTLKAGLYRAEFSHGEGAGAIIENWISWIDPGTEQPDFHVPASFGLLELISE